MAGEDLTYLTSIPWCSLMISNPLYTITPTNSRKPKASTEDALFAETLNTGSTIPTCVSLYKIPLSPHEPIAEVRTLLSLESGLNGYPRVCHGGVIATVLDEVMGLLLSLNKDRDEKSADTSRKAGGRAATVTAELAIRYLKPVITPQVICVTARLVKSEGRKIWLRGTVEDGHGTALVEAEGVFVRIGREKL